MKFQDLDLSGSDTLCLDMWEKPKHSTVFRTEIEYRYMYKMVMQN